MSSEIHFIHNPNFIFIEPAGNNIFVNEIPKDIIICNKPFSLICATAYKPEHMVGIFVINNDLYLVDDLSNTATLLPTPDEKILGRRVIPDDYFYFKKWNITGALYFLK